MTFHTEIAGANGQRQAMFIERVSGLAEVILANFNLRPTDAMMIFSASGRNAVPVETAILARKAGLQVIAVTSVVEARAVPPMHSSGTVLADNADIVIDLCTPLGDAVVDISGWSNKVGPTSTVANAAIVNTVKVLTAQKLADRGVELPVLTGSSARTGPPNSSRMPISSMHGARPTCSRWHRDEWRLGRAPSAGCVPPAGGPKFPHR
jgi:uncharacterized phosphosugar-binding protein